MGSSYAVIWRDGEGWPVAGKLELTGAGLLLEGQGAEGEVVQVLLASAELAAVRVGRAPPERVNGCPSLILERHRGPPLHLSPLSDLGLVLELGEMLAVLLAATDGRSWDRTSDLPRVKRALSR